MTRPHAEWVNDCDARLLELHDNVPARKQIVDANAEMIDRAMSGKGPDKPDIVPELGARMAVNIAAVHIPAFCDPARNQKAYLNGYDTHKLTVLGAKAAPPAHRELVDDAIAPLTGHPASEMYFGGIELNGAGIRFYGDVCLILKCVHPSTVVLTSNSYDLIRPPMTARNMPPDPATLPTNACKMSGRWEFDLKELATLKVLALQPATERRLTTGQISETVLDDEDYLELLRIGTFNITDLHEARLNAADVAAENQILEDTRLGPAPSLAEEQWHKHRRAAAAAFAKHKIRLKVVTTAGRVR